MGGHRVFSILLEILDNPHLTQLMNGRSLIFMCYIFFSSAVSYSCSNVYSLEEKVLSVEVLFIHPQAFLHDYLQMNSLKNTTSLPQIAASYIGKSSALLIS